MAGFAWSASSRSRWRSGEFWNTWAYGWPMPDPYPRHIHLPSPTPPPILASPSCLRARRRASLNFPLPNGNAEPALPSWCLPLDAPVCSILASLASSPGPSLRSGLPIGTVPDLPLFATSSHHEAHATCGGVLMDTQLCYLLSSPRLEASSYLLPAREAKRSRFQQQSA
jgi:hypothetical protein